MDVLNDYIPKAVNQGPWVTAYTWPKLAERHAERQAILPVCSLGTPSDALLALGDFLLPPLYHEALDDALKAALLDRINTCYPTHRDNPHAAQLARVKVVELPPQSHPPPASPSVVAFSADTGVEQHGPHLPLATDTIQSYDVLAQLANDHSDLYLAPPVEYGQLLWGLPIGYTVDLGATLTREYVTRYIQAIVEWTQPKALYMVDVHGSPVHREAIGGALGDAGLSIPHAFRWLHEPLADIVQSLQDPHAGAIETAVVANIEQDLVCAEWWPLRQKDLRAKQMSLADVLRLQRDLPTFFDTAAKHGFNGIVGHMEAMDEVDAPTLRQRMVGLANDDVAGLLAS